MSFGLQYVSSTTRRRMYTLMILRRSERDFGYLYLCIGETLDNVRGQVKRYIKIYIGRYIYLYDDEPRASRISFAACICYTYVYSYIRIYKI